MRRVDSQRMARPVFSRAVLRSCDDRTEASLLSFEMTMSAGQMSARKNAAPLAVSALLKAAPGYQSWGREERTVPSASTATKPASIAAKPPEIILRSSPASPILTASPAPSWKRGEYNAPIPDFGLADRSHRRVLRSCQGLRPPKGNEQETIDLPQLAVRHR